MMRHDTVYISQRSISNVAARRCIAAAERSASDQGIAISTLIVDQSGVLKAFARMDGAPLVSVEAARKKALTAVGMGMPTGHSWLDFIEGDPVLELGVHSLPDFTFLGGGAPLLYEGELIGAIGISGGHYSADEACCEAAVAALLELACATSGSGERP